ncbi:MAG: polyprenyl synthetase family protein [Desulfobacteraceae bacterium]|nr:polyprenyl synthetase family protein [Desulfobacteraceae bacterium]
MKQSELLATLEPETAKIDAAMRADLAGIGSPPLLEILEHAIFNGGKRIRPALTIFAASLSGAGTLPADTYRLAIAFEYLHAASLLHDDVIDHADQRRGNASANALWGNSTVILAGDYLHARAFLLAGTTAGAQCLDLLGRATAAMVEAEFLQMDTAREANRAEDNYFAILRGKTGALIAAAAEAGAVLAGASARQRAAMRTYGGNLGLAFQLVDDLLDYLGDPRLTGKKVGNDLHEGRMTLPLLIALRQAEGEDRSFLEQILSLKSDDRAAQLERVRGAIERNGGFSATRDQAAELIRTATAELELFPPSPARQVLAALAAYVLARKK